MHIKEPLLLDDAVPGVLLGFAFIALGCRELWAGDIPRALLYMNTSSFVMFAAISLRHWHKTFLNFVAVEYRYWTFSAIAIALILEF